MITVTKTKVQVEVTNYYKLLLFSPDRICAQRKLATFSPGLETICVFISFGIKFTTGILNLYLIPFFNITNGETLWFHATIVSCHAVAAPIASAVANKIGVLPVVIIGCKFPSANNFTLFSSVGVFASFATVDKSLGLFICTFGILNGLGIGFPYSTFYADVSKVRNNFIYDVISTFVSVAVSMAFQRSGRSCPWWVSPRVGTLYIPPKAAAQSSRSSRQQVGLSC